MFLPHITDLMTDSKLSLINIISDESLATEHPDPIANPTSAVLRASQSLIPSPVTATALPSSFRPTTNNYLSYGMALLNTLSLLAIY
jgi:hypothetical protein